MSLTHIAQAAPQGNVMAEVAKAEGSFVANVPATPSLGELTAAASMPMAPAPSPFKVKG
jgi:hypothetical protein